MVTVRFFSSLLFSSRKMFKIVLFDKFTVLSHGSGSGICISVNSRKWHHSLRIIRFIGLYKTHVHVRGCVEVVAIVVILFCTNTRYGPASVDFDDLDLLLKVDCHCGGVR